jgi:hypothetical protein
MCHGVIAGLLVGAIAAKALMRWRWHRMGGGCGGGGGGCGGGGYRRWGHWRHSVPVDGDNARRVVELLGQLELNDRQRDEATSAFDGLKRTLGERFAAWGGLDVVLAAIAGATFDRAGVEAALGGAPKELLDDLEHVHNILTPEQRSRIAQVVAGDAPRASVF